MKPSFYLNKKGTRLYHIYPTVLGYEHTIIVETKTNRKSVNYTQLSKLLKKLTELK